MNVHKVTQGIHHPPSVTDLGSVIITGSLLLLRRQDTAITTYVVHRFLIPLKIGHKAGVEGIIFAASVTASCRNLEIVFVTVGHYRLIVVVALLQDLLIAAVPAVVHLLGIRPKGVVGRSVGKKGLFVVASRCGIAHHKLRANVRGLTAGRGDKALADALLAKSQAEGELGLAGVTGVKHRVGNVNGTNATATGDETSPRLFVFVIGGRRIVGDRLGIPLAIHLVHA